MQDAILYMLENMVNEKFGVSPDENTKRGFGKRENQSFNYKNASHCNSFEKRLVQMSKQIDLPQEIILYESGRYIFREFVKKYPHVIRNNKTSAQFLESTENLLSLIISDYNNLINFPKINLKKRRDGDLLIDYHSQQRSCTMIEGIIKSVADYFNQKVNYHQPLCQNRGDNFCSFTIQFYDKILN